MLRMSDSSMLLIRLGYFMLRMMDSSMFLIKFGSLMVALGAEFVLRLLAYGIGPRAGNLPSLALKVARSGPLSTCRYSICLLDVRRRRSPIGTAG